MTEQTQDKSTTHKPRRRFALSTIVLGLLIVTVAFLWFRSRHPSIEDRLAAIEAARTIPDSENAAVLYNRLMADANATSFDIHPAFLDKHSGIFTLRRPWSTLDYPELADWINERQWLIDELMTGLQFEKCRFPINIDLYTSPALEPIWTMRKWAYLLMRASGNDIGESRIDGAIAKWRCIIRMADHLYQQPTAIDRLIGIGLEQLSLGQVAVVLATGDVDENRLKKIEPLVLQTRDDWATVLQTILAVEKLAEEKVRERLSLADRLSFEFRVRKIVAMSSSQREQLHWLYTKTLLLRRGTHILIALRCCKNEQGHWPGSLYEIRSEVPPEMLVDPFNKGGFAYRLTDDGFTLHSKGENNIDEDGQYKSGSEKGPDDWPIWPPRGHKTQSQDAKNE